MSSRAGSFWSGGSLPLIDPETLGDILTAAGDIVIVMSADGRLRSVLVNPENAEIGDLGHWEGRDLSDVLTVESLRRLERHLSAPSDGTSPPPQVELVHVDDGEWEFPVRYSLHRIGPDGAVLLLGRDLRPVAEAKQQLAVARLELDNERQLQRIHDARCRALMEYSADAVIFVSLERGRITEASAAAASLTGVSRDDLGDSRLDRHFGHRGRGSLLDALAAQAAADPTRPVRAICDPSGVHVGMMSRLLRTAGEPCLLCRLEPEGGQVRPAGDSSTPHASFFEESVDAIVFTDAQGAIRAGNEAFLGLADVAHLSLATGRPLAEFLSHGSVDAKVMIGNAIRSGNMRNYATRLVSVLGRQTPVEIAVTSLSDSSDSVLAFVIRDAGSSEVPPPSGGAVRDDGMRDVMGLVGSADLKDIVTRTTDAVEKMCIETAVELTGNNRVAAAEMLGLSRQSLYVKLRKFGLLDKGTGDS